MADEDVLDLSDHTCLPGLIDMHVHLGILPEDADDYTVYLRRTPEDTLRLAEELVADGVDFIKVIASGAESIKDAILERHNARYSERISLS